MFTENYWNQRVKKHGHTGHSEQFYYCFDQQARIHAVSKILETLPQEKKTALDFGCGSGDFLELLSKKYAHVIAYDISSLVLKKAIKRMPFNNISFINSLDKLNGVGKFDLILSVTVLYSLEKQKLASTLEFLSEHLSHDGHFVAMEFFLDENNPQMYTENKATYADWNKLLYDNRLKIISTFNFYNPITLPSQSWVRYKTNLFLRLLLPFKKSRLIQRYFSKVAKKLIDQQRDVIIENESPFNIFVIRKM